VCSRSGVPSYFKQRQGGQLPKGQPMTRDKMFTSAQGKKEDGQEDELFFQKSRGKKN